ncbi:uncharacterized protein LOC130673509 [Microplitis mediator]|uniref:uncharacterized protein LOC130673509 n=1 Tax=Microplitis mediator TaxID=375433 RepID=UPI0025557710|nr:uncharacterized protein LOC130673509 [Microplitis mediator]
MGTCQCGGHYEGTTKECHTLVKNIDDSCTDHLDCKKIPFTQCVDEKCQCLPNFERKGDVCKGLLGANCTSDFNCLANLSCNNGTCQCDGHYDGSPKESYKLVETFADLITEIVKKSHHFKTIVLNTFQWLYSAMCNRSV